ncbi:PAS domain-containing protein [Lysinibacillus sp. 54212]|uniref:PAS domain-containing protein n=1 Tax=Lysinibacillus sp. 54212 TaxID=3119829 RepID=UPI002FC85877
MLAQNIKPLSKEQLFSSLCNICEQYSTGVAIINPHDELLSIMYSNEAFTELTGYSKLDLIGKNLDILNGLKTDTKLNNELQHHLKNFKPIKTRILHYQRDASPFWNEITAHPIQDENEKVQFIMVHFTDVTFQTLYKMLSKLEHEVYRDIEKGGELEHILQLITTQIETYYTRNVYCAIHLIGTDQSTYVTAVSSLPKKIASAIQDNEFKCYLTSDCETVYVKKFKPTEISSLRKIENTLAAPLRFPIRCSWSKPICDSKDAIVGFFTFYFENEPILKQTDIDFLNRLAPVISLAIKYAAQTQQLRQLAYYDSATNLPNLHYFQTELT